MAKRVSIAQREHPKSTAPAVSTLLLSAAREGLVMVAPGDLEPNPHQPRTTFDDDKLQELAASLKQDGLIEPIVVRPCGGGKYQVIAGERRRRAAQLAEVTQLPALIKDCSDDEMELLALEENLHREDLNEVDRGKALKSLKARLDLTWEQLGQRVGLSRRRVLMLAGLADLPDDIQDQVAAGRLTEKHTRALTSIPEPPQQRQFLEVVQRERLSGDRAIAAAKRLREDPSQDIERAVQAVARPQAPAKEDGSAHARQAAARLVQALDGVDPAQLSCTQRQHLAADLAALIKTARRLVGQLQREADSR